jgi:methionyl-tRNA synthetase
MAERYAGGRVAPTGEPGPLAAAAAETLAAYRAAMDVYALHEGASAVYRLLGSANEYIEQTRPWAMAKDPEASGRLGQVLFDVAETVRVAAVLLLPIMPTSAREILRRVGEPADPATLRLERDAAWRASGDRTVVKGEALWPRLEAASAPAPPGRGPMSDSPISTPPVSPATAAPVPAATPPASAPQGPAAATPAAVPEATAPGSSAAEARIGYDDFMKVDLRVAKVTAAERIPKAKKLLKLTVDVGTEVRTIVAGLALAYEPEALVGKSIAIVANLQPRAVMGIESNGMVLAGGGDADKPELVTFAEPPPPGSRIR